MTWVRRRVIIALARHALVSVEATGAWDNDWRLADDPEVAAAATGPVAVVTELRPLIEP